MSIRTYKRGLGENTLIGRDLPLYGISSDGSIDKETLLFRPGDWVAHIIGGGTGKGIIISITDDAFIILWSDDPHKGLSSFVLPRFKPVFQSLVAQNVINIQPMPVPQSRIFYVEYMYPSVTHVTGSIDSTQSVCPDDLKPETEPTNSP